MHSIQDSGQDSRSLRDTGRRVAWGSAALLVAGSIAFATPALAAPSDTGRAHASSHSGGQGSSSVHLAKPNGYQAQSDPDGMDNGGVDQPGGTGGVDKTSQDGNNGSGNDADCEDDNRGVGVPGHCKDRDSSDQGSHASEGTDNGESTESTEGTDTTDSPEQPAASDQGGQTEVFAPTSDQPVTATHVDQADAGLTAAWGQTQVSAPVAPAAQGAAAPTSATVAPAKSVASPAGFLPNTGAGQALLGLTTLALMLLALGGGLLRQSRRPVRIHR